jgi:hypothetical protein
MMKKALIVVGLAISGVAAGADGLPVEPGLWEMTSTVHMPMLPQPQVNTQTECLDKPVMSLDELQKDEMDPNCEFETAQIDDTTVKWSVDCPVEGGGTARGEWQATSHGDRIEGDGTMTMSVQGQEMNMTMSWTGKRVGACP